MSERIEHPDTHFGTESGHHLVTVTWWHMADKDEIVHEETNITPQEALSFARDLVTRAEQALETQARDALMGNCKRCGNLRMVEETPPGHRSPWQVHCPVCTDDGQPKKRLPTMKIWATEEAKKIRPVP